MNNVLIDQTYSAVETFIKWLEKYGEISFDHQSYYAGGFGGRAKALYYKSPVLGTLAVSPMVFSEAFLPSARRLFWKKQRLPIADAHYAMGFSFLFSLTGEKKYYDKATHFLKVLEDTGCPDYEHYCWGYPFDWETRGGAIIKGTPLITTTPYAYEAFLEVYQIDNEERWLEILGSIVEHVVTDIKDFRFSGSANTCSYTPHDQGGVINASAYRAFLLTSASVVFSEEKYWEIAEHNLNFVLENQKPNGSWLYSIEEERDFVDHFHTCFVLKALAKIEKLKGHEGCTEAIQRGIQYYIETLFDKNRLPKPFSKAPRLTVYRNELYDYAECINLCVLLRDRFEELDNTLVIVLNDILNRWRKKDGSFRSRKLLAGWDNVPMHRWAQSQLFRSLCFLLYNDKAI